MLTLHFPRPSVGISFLFRLGLASFQGSTGSSSVLSEQIALSLLHSKESQIVLDSNFREKAVLIAAAN